MDNDHLLMPKSVAPPTATAMLERQSRSMIAHAMHRLLHRLRPYMRAYPIADEPMPEHDMDWVVTDFDCGPDQVIAEAMQTTPALWMQFLPPEVCIVSRNALGALPVGGLRLNEDFIDCLVMEGTNIVMARAAQKLHELEDAERERRY